MTSLLVTGGRIVDPTLRLDALRDLRLRDGRVHEIGEALAPELDEEVVDARGVIVAPGFVDMHVHLRDPGFPEKETLESGTEAAVRGGFTTVACMPNTLPALDDADTLFALARKAGSVARCRVVPIAAITRGRCGEQLVDFAALVAAGAVGFSDDGDTVENEALLREGALLAHPFAAPFISHAEPEDRIVQRDLMVAMETGKSWHVAHVTTRVALDLVRKARAAGVRVTCEVTPHHLTFTAALRAEFGPAVRVNPPLRDDDDVRALREGVRDGTIDAFATDHAPHTAHEKATGAAPGFSGLEIAAGAYAAALPDLNLTRFIELISTNPARILGLDAGTLRVGAPADVTIFADRPWIVDSARFASKGRCTPFDGRSLPRQILATIVSGDVRFLAVTERAA